jgi:hypothetical protein
MLSGDGPQPVLVRRHVQYRFLHDDLGKAGMGFVRVDRQGCLDRALGFVQAGE